MPQQQRAPDSVRRRTLLGAAWAAGWATLAGCGGSPDYPPGPLRIATGGPGGVYYAYGNGIAEAVRARLPLLTPQVIATAASIENIRMVAAGAAEVGFSLADSAGSAHFGQPPFDTPLPMAALGRLYDNYLHLVAHPDRPVGSVEQLRGRKVSVGAAGSGTELTATRLLAESGLDIDRDLSAFEFGVDESAAALAAGNLDAFFFSGGIPTAAIDGLAQRLPIKLVNLGGAVPALRARFGEVYAERTIPASAYRLGVPVATVGVPNYLVVAASMNEQPAQALIETLFAERDVLARAHPEGRRLDRGSAINTYPLPLHPGAERYYRAAKR